MTVPIPITRGYVTLVDDDDLPIVNQYPFWVFKPRADGVGGYAVAHPKGSPVGTTIYLHRLLMAPPIGMVVDHVNGDGLDNRRANMRVTDQRGNARNLHPELHGGPDTRVAPTRLTRRRDAGLVRVAS